MLQCSFIYIEAFFYKFYWGKCCGIKKKVYLCIPVSDTNLHKFEEYKQQQFRGVAQLVAHLVWDQGVAGSNPVTPTTERH